jgi:hypothetical protein
MDLMPSRKKAEPLTKEDGIRQIDDLINVFERLEDETLGTELLEEMMDRASTARDARAEDGDEDLLEEEDEEDEDGDEA